MPTQKTLKIPISSSALAILRKEATVTKDGIKLTCGQLERDDYEQVNQVLERIGGKWKGNKKMHVFPFDPRPLFQAVISSGMMPPKNPLAYFPTPKGVYERLMAHEDVADLIEFKGKSLRALEPSAGQGALIKRMIECGVPANCIEACELDDLNCRVLKSAGVKLVGSDFLQYHPKKKYDLIVMNPPFSVEGDKKAYITHIEHAFSLLSPEGLLFAITPTFDHLSDSRTNAFRALVRECGDSTPIEAGAFKESGTNIPTRAVFLKKPDAERTKRNDAPCNGHDNTRLHQFYLLYDNDFEQYTLANKLRSGRKVSREDVRTHAQQAIQWGAGKGIQLTARDTQAVQEQFLERFALVGAQENADEIYEDPATIARQIVEDLTVARDEFAQLARMLAPSNGQKSLFDDVPATSSASTSLPVRKKTNASPTSTRTASKRAGAVRVTRAARPLAQALATGTAPSRSRSRKQGDNQHLGRSSFTP